MRPERREAKEKLPRPLTRDEIETSRLADKQKIVDLQQELARARRQIRQLIQGNRELTSNVNDLATDNLTGIFNREGLQLAFKETLISEHGAIIFIDLDKFKPINDIYGHDAGDEALSVVGKLLRNNIRGNDDIIALYKLPDEDYVGRPEVIDNNSLLARFGGDEFLVILEDISPQDAQNKLEKLEAEFDALSFNWAGKTIQFGASLGMEIFERGDNLDDIRRRADKKMYDAKKKKGAQRDAYNL